MTPEPSIFSNKWTVFSLLAIAATAAKAGISLLGYNYDVQSFYIVSDLVVEGKNFYAETARHVYGPVWAYLLGAIRFLQLSLLNDVSIQNFHLLLALFLSLADIAIGFALWRYFSFAAGCLFLINPVSLLLTGYHSQIENLAILPGIMACGLLAAGGKNRQFKFWAGVGLLALSLSVKHIFFLIPVWFLFNKSLNLRERLILFFVPAFIFLISFIPFVIANPAAFDRVKFIFTGYSSTHMSGFYPQLIDLFFPVKFFEKAFSILPIFSGFKLIWIITLASLGLLLKNKSPLESCLIYLVAVCVTSSALVEQYLAIPMVSCIVFRKNPAMRWYIYLATIFLATSPANIGSLPAMSWLAAPTQAVGLQAWHPVAGMFIFLVWYFCRPKLQWSRKPAQNTEREIIIEKESGV